MQHIISTIAGSSVWPALSGIVFAVIALGLLIFVHEMGHFLMAKLSGVGVLKFSLGFGKKLVGWKIGETEYMVSAFPLGGYVKMMGEDDDGEGLSAEDKKRSFSEQLVHKRAAIVFAGPLFNILLAFLLFYFLFLAGFPTAIAKVAYVVPGSAAQKAGFKAGDVVEKIDGVYIDIWEQVSEYVKAKPEKEMSFNVRRDGSNLLIKAAPEDVKGKGDMGLLGTVVVGAVMDHSPADLAGIKTKDKIVSVDGNPVGSWTEMAQIVKANPGKKLLFTIERDGKLYNTYVTPTLNESAKPGEKKYGVIGVQMGSESRNVSYGPVESLGLAAERTFFMTKLTVGFLARLIRGKEDASQIGGPLAIVQLSGREANQGIRDFIIFIALLSVNLGVINLFPIPILDGGQLLFFGIEAAKGKPLGMRKREIAQQIGLVMLVLLMIFVMRNDIMRFLGFLPMWK